MNELAVQGNTLTVGEVVAQVQLIQQVMEKVMKKDVHFGIIPGCVKPSLWKPGAEKLLSTFQLVADNPIIEDLSSYDESRYRVTQRILRMSDGRLVGAASGECSSDEEKYKWRKPVCDAEYDETSEDRKRAAWKKGQGGSVYQQKQVRTHPKDVANTILKMAVKRALVAVTLEVTAASDIFDQDLEDLPEGLAGQEEQGRPPIQRPQEKAGTNGKADAPAGPVPAIVQIAETKPKVGKGPHKITDAAGVVYGTFSDTYFKDATAAVASGVSVKITFTTNQYGHTLTSLEVIAERAPGEDG